MSDVLEQGSRVRLSLTVERITFDPTDWTVEAEIDGDLYPATWAAPAVKVSSNPDRWTRPATSDGYFSSGTEADTVTLTRGRHLTGGQLTKGTERVRFRGAPLVVA